MKKHRTELKTTASLALLLSFAVTPAFAEVAYTIGTGTAYAYAEGDTGYPRTLVSFSTKNDGTGFRNANGTDARSAAYWRTPIGAGVSTQNAFASYDVRANFGDLGVITSSKATRDLSSVIYNGNTAWVNPYLASAKAYTIVAYFDTLNVVSSTLPTGTPVELRFGMSLDSANSSYGVPTRDCGDLTAGSLVYAGFDLPGLNVETMTGTCNGQITHTVSYYDVPTQEKTTDHIAVPHEEFYLDFWTKVGAVFDFHNYLGASANSGTETSDLAWATVYAYNSSHTSIEVLTPDVTYLTTSGTIYPSSLPTVTDSAGNVPEPASVLLFAVGGVSLFGYRKSKVARR